MPLRIVRAPDTRTLWETCTDRFLDQLGDNHGPSGFTARAWVAQESQVDLLYELAVGRGFRGWLGPPVTTLRGLPALFDLRARRVGLLTRRRLISRIANRIAGEVGIRDPSRGDGLVRGHMLDTLFGELLPEGVAPERLRETLDELPGDDFSRRRNQWVVRTYAGYLDALSARDRIDARQTNGLIADRIDSGGLPEALGGAGVLHLYGLYTTRSRQRLLEALGRQTDVAVLLYALAPATDDPEPGELAALDAEVEVVGEQGPGRSNVVQPAPDTQRETEWVARQVKRLLVQQEIEPHRVAVVARSGRDDTGRVHRALRDAGVSATTIVRARLTEIAALKPLLALFRGAAANWTYRTLRPVVDNTLLDIDLDLRCLDFIASGRRVEGLEQWKLEYEKLLARLRDPDASGRPRSRSVRGRGLRADAVARDLEAFRRVCPALASLAGARTEARWIELTLELLRGEHAAAFNLRQRLCEPVRGGTEHERWDVVRLDQRGLRRCEILLREWLDLDHGRERLEVAAWARLLRRMLEANELSLSTPLHKGVQVLEAHDAAMFPFEHVFVVHANDGVFPRPLPTGGVLSNDERATLRQAGIPVSWRDLELRRERALWRAVTSAGDVTVTYRTADPGGTPLLPSLLVPPHAPDTELPRTRTRYEAADERFVAVTLPQADHRAAVAFHDLIVGTDRGPELRPGEPALLAHAVVAAVAESHRDSGARAGDADQAALRPNPWNGWLRDPRLLDRLGNRFDDDYRWSPSALEAYSKLPFQFLLDRVLRYEAAAEADEQVTPLVFGAAAHDLLERFYRRVKDDLPAEFDARAEAALAEAADEALAAARDSEEWLGAEILWEQQWARLREQVRAYLVWELGHLNDKGERPELIEHEFGFGDESVTIEGVDVDGAPARLRLCGRIDRVDVAREQHQVLDYKSNATPGANDYVDGTALQAPLYMQVLEDSGRAVSLGYYRSLRRRTQYAGKVKRSEGKYAAALRFALSIPGRLRAGLFEPVRAHKAGEWPTYAATPDIARSRARLPGGNRYEDVQPLQPETAPGADAVTQRAPGVEAVAPTADESAEPPRLPFAEPGPGDA